MTEWKFSQNLVKFDDSLPLMEEKVRKIVENGENDLIWLLEHEKVITAGVSAKAGDLLNAGSIPVVQTNRGGKYTYHGPGMIVGYLMMDLKRFFAPEKPDIARFVDFIERWLINFLAKFEIEGFIRKDRVGIWVFENGVEKKIGAIGIKVRKWVTYHGFALNIDPDLADFGGIVPCGIRDFGVTSLQKMGVDLEVDFYQMLKNAFYETEL